MADEAPKVKIRMLRDDRGSENGFDVQGYEAGKTYEVPASLAVAFCDQRGSAQRVTAATHIADAAAAAGAVVSKAVEAIADAVAPAAQEEMSAAPEGEAAATEGEATGAKRSRKKAE